MTNAKSIIEKYSKIAPIKCNCDGGWDFDLEMSNRCASAFANPTKFTFSEFGQIFGKDEVFGIAAMLWLEKNGYEVEWHHGKENMDIYFFDTKQVVIVARNIAFVLKEMMAAKLIQERWEIEKDSYTFSMTLKKGERVSKQEIEQKNIITLLYRDECAGYGRKTGKIEVIYKVAKTRALYEKYLATLR